MSKAEEIVIQRLKQLVKESKKEVKIKGILALASLKACNDFAVPLLLEVVVDEDSKYDTRLRAMARDALVAVGEPALIDVMKLLDRTKDPEDPKSGPDENMQLTGLSIMHDIVMFGRDRAEAEKHRKEQIEIETQIKASIMAKKSE
jgi:hypothetical protein